MCYTETILGISDCLSIGSFIKLSFDADRCIGRNKDGSDPYSTLFRASTILILSSERLVIRLLMNANTKVSVAETR